MWWFVAKGILCLFADDFASRTEQQLTLRELISPGLIVIPMVTTPYVLATRNLRSGVSFFAGVKEERNDMHRRKGLRFLECLTYRFKEIRPEIFHAFRQT